MPYTLPWDEDVPAGSTDADKIDDRMRDIKTAVRERLGTLLGLDETGFTADPLVPNEFNASGFTGTFPIKGGTTGTSIRNNADNADNFKTDDSGNCTARGTLAGTNGPNHLLDGWTVTNIAASQSAVEMDRSLGRVLMLQAGSVIGVGVALGAGQAWSAGTLTVEVYKAVINTTTGARTETATGLTAVIDTTNKAVKVTTQAAGADTFAVGDELFLRYTTDGSWAPTTADMTASILVRV